MFIHELCTLWTVWTKVMIKFVKVASKAAMDTEYLGQVENHVLMLSIFLRINVRYPFRIAESRCTLFIDLS